ncbi:TerC family protein [Microbacterium oleivorans]|uniref:TerC family protein n=1 Tax=Microbacterium oleivorans TaxID=273677 RepID=UPI0007679EE8|nr:TerC family protein [Microbacterium oleivorans]THE07081.1 TerC family protein [Microbacterium oleivorans]
MELPLWFEVGSLVGLTLILVADLLLIIKRPHVPSTKESTLWVVFYVVLALLFALLMLAVTNGEYAGQFVAGWLTEYSLSIDNLFVFVLIMSQFSVPRAAQQKVLMVGIIIALILRGIFILLGAAIIEQFSWVFYVFGAFLIYTAWRQAFPGDEDEDEEKKESFIVRLLRRRIAVSDEYDGAKVRTVLNGKKVFTPMIIVFAALGMTDLLFAIDSIPAIFGITQSPFIVFTANLFALMGLRQLYFLLGGLLDRLKYLHFGIAFILAFIGVKLVLHAMHENELPFINGGEHIEWAPEISTWVSLGVIVASMLVATVASLIAARRDGLREPVPATGPTPVGHAEDVADEQGTPRSVDSHPSDGDAAR